MELNATMDPLERTAITILAENWHGHATVPSGNLYPHQWSWDSAFIAFGLQHWAPQRAAAELLSLLGGQWSDGRVPHIVFNPAVDEHAYFPGPGFWRSATVPGAPPVATSGIIQPPVHAMAALALMDQLERPIAFGRRIYPLLAAQNDYLVTRRLDPGTGLAFLLHPWESGLDNCPSWDAPLAAVPADLGLFDHYTRRDLDHAGEGERPTNEDYARYIRLALAYRDHGYDDDWARAEAEFVVVDPVFNSLWGWSELALAGLAEWIGRDREPHLANAARITEALSSGLFSPGSGLAQAYDVRTERLQAEATVGGALPLLLPDLPPGRVAGIVHALTGAGFEVDSPLTFGVPSYDRISPKYDASRYWRGPTWLNTTWLVAVGLRQHGQAQLAAKLDADLITLVERSGFREYFNPVTGSGHGTDRFSWTAAIVLHLLRGSTEPIARSVVARDSDHLDQLLEPQKVGLVLGDQRQTLGERSRGNQ